MPDIEEEKLRKLITGKREIVTVMFTGESGQDVYDCTIRFGPKSLSRHARGLDLVPCIPGVESDHWFEVDQEKMSIIIQLL